ncbi:MAG TPA: glycosyltransferase family 1 protein [Acidimicrobiales bacterium]|nr:glycosyltransferase family 1 protein [Acidimicrobiales bacterium]
MPARQPSVLLVVQQLRRSVPGGIGTYTRGLLKGLVDDPPAGGAAVTLFAGRPGRRPDPLEALRLPLRNSLWPAPALSRLWRLGLADVPGRFDLVHATSLDAPPARRRKLVVTVYDLAWREVPEAFPARGRRWHEAAFRHATRHAEKLVVPSAPVAEALSAAGVGDDRLQVIPPGSDHLPAPDEDGASVLLNRLGVRGDFLLTVSTLEPRKNLDRLMDAYRRARSALGEQLPLVVVGPGGWGGRPAAGAGVDGAARDPAGVVMAGAVEAASLAALYRRARLLAFVPLLEGFGLPPLEAMTAGTPVVSSPVPSIGEAALVVDPRDVDAIADGIVRLASDGELRRQLITAGAARAASFTWAETARLHRQLWQSLA